MTKETLYYLIILGVVIIGHFLNLKKLFKMRKELKEMYILAKILLNILEKREERKAVRSNGEMQ